MKTSYATLSDHLGSITNGLCAAVAARSPLLPQWLIALTSGRLHAITARLLALFARLHARTYRSPPRRAPIRPRTQAAPRKPLPEQRLPRARAWLLRLLPSAASAYASALARLMQDPAFGEAVCTAPAMRRDLRALCHMLGIAPPDFLTPPESDPPPAPLTAAQRKTTLRSLSKKQKTFRLFGSGESKNVAVKQENPSFLKKRSKKLSSIAAGTECGPAHAVSSKTDKRFFGSFLQKRTPCFAFSP